MSVKSTDKKSPTKTERGMAFPVGAFAFAPDPQKPSGWKLRLFDRPQDVPGKPSVVLTAAAAQALSPAGFRGQPVKLPPGERRSVVRRVSRAWLKARRDRGDQVSSSDLPLSLKTVKNQGDLAVSLKLDNEGREAFERLVNGLPSVTEKAEALVHDLTELAGDLVITEKATDVASLDIRQVVNDKTWQKIREDFVGTWKETPAKNVKRLRQYLGKKPWNPMRVRRVLNYLTGSAFRIGRISHPDITALLTSIRAWWKVDENRMLKSVQEAEKVDTTLAQLVKDIDTVAAQVQDESVKKRLSELADQVRKDLAVPQTEKSESPEPTQTDLKVEFSIIKAEAAKVQDEYTVLGEVLVPDEVDAQNDTYSADEVRKTAWKFMEEYQVFGFMHKDIGINVKVLESFLAPIDYTVNGAKIKKGTWLVRVRVLDSSIWKDIKSGKLTGFSIGGTAIRRPEVVGSKS